MTETAVHCPPRPPSPIGVGAGRPSRPIHSRRAVSRDLEHRSHTAPTVLTHGDRRACCCSPKLVCIAERRVGVTQPSSETRGHVMRNTCLYKLVVIPRERKSSAHTKTTVDSRYDVPRVAAVMISPHCTVPPTPGPASRRAGILLRDNGASIRCQYTVCPRRRPSHTPSERHALFHSLALMST